MRNTLPRVLAVVALAYCCAPVLFAQTSLTSFPTPPPKYQITVQKGVRMPMRDMVPLSADIYIPVGTRERQRLPAILIRTPYNKSSEVLAGLAGRFAAQGYVVVVQDVRGKFESGGIFNVSMDDADDGSDTVDWILSQSWSNGRVGTTGCSYSGENQVELARERTPHHLAMIPQAASGSLQYFGSWRGGAFELAADSGWFLSNGVKERPHVAPGSPRPPDFIPPKVDWPSLWRSLPLKGMMDRAGMPATDWDDFVSHPEGDPWWKSRGYITTQDRFSIPSLFLDSWYDYGPADTFRLADLIRKNSESDIGRNNQFVIIAPTTHCAFEQASEHTVVGQRDLGDARVDYFGLYLAWFDHWLRDVDNGVDKMPRVQYYVMGRNQWRGENDWPPARAVPTQVYLRSSGHANSRFGDGILSTDRPSEEPPDHFVYDPRTPVPSVGGPDWGATLDDLKSGAQDQSDVEMRQDVLVYTSPVLAKGAEVTGNVEVVLFVASDAPDTDFTAKLVDVYPDGTSFNLLEGIQRMRYREGLDKLVSMKPGDAYEVHINLGATSNFFLPGHRMRLEVSSSNFPRFDRNLNTAGNNYDESTWRIARQTVYHSGTLVSYALLPIVP